MKKFRWHNILIYGSSRSRREEVAACAILLALYALVWVMDPAGGAMW